MDREGKLCRQKDFLVKFAYWAVWGAIAVLGIKLLGSVLLPFIAAFLIAWLLSVPVDFLSGRLHLKRGLSAVAIVALFYALAACLIYLTCSKLLGFVRDIFSELSAFLAGSIYPVIERFCGWLDGLMQGTFASGRAAGDPGAVIAHASEVVSDVSGNVISGVTDMASCIPGFCMNILIAMIATLFMELDFPKIRDFLRRQVPKRWQEAVAGGKDYVVGTLGKCALSYALIMLMTFAELSVGFLLLGAEGAFTIAFLAAVLDILPVLGTGMVLLPWALVSFASGDAGMGAGLIALYLIVTVVRNIVEPKLVGRQMGLSPAVMLPCMWVGLKFFGIFGLFAVPFGVAFLNGLNERGIIHILPSWKDGVPSWKDGRPPGKDGMPPGKDGGEG